DGDVTGRGVAGQYARIGVRDREGDRGGGTVGRGGADHASDNAGGDGPAGAGSVSAVSAVSAAGTARTTTTGRGRAAATTRADPEGLHALADQQVGRSLSGLEGQPDLDLALGEVVG